MAGWTAPKTWVDGPMSAAELNEQLRDNLLALNPPPIIKSANESVNLSATLQNDDELVYALPDTGTFTFEVHIFASSAANAAGDIQFGFSFPTGTLHFAGIGPHNSLASGSSGDVEFIPRLSATSGVTNIPYGLSTSGLYIYIHGVLIATAAGSLQLMWAQQASNANNSTVLAGSHMIVRQGA